MVQKSLPLLALTALALPLVASAADSVTSPVAQLPTGTSTSLVGDPPRGPRYKASFTYLTSRSASSDFRSFRGSATDDSGQLTEGSALPNMNYLSSRLSYSPWNRHTFSGGDLQSLDSASKRTVLRPDGSGGFPMPSSIWSLRYGYRINDHFNAGLSETYVQGRKFSDPMAGLTYRSNRFDEQGLAHRVGLNLSVPTTERSHNDQLITRATLRTSLAYVAGPWTSSAGIAYSRPFFEHPGNLAASNFDDPSAPPGSPQSGPAGGGASSHHSGGRGGHSVTSTDPTDPNAVVYVPEPASIAMQEREADRTTSSVGVSFQPNSHWRFGSAMGVTYLETWRQKTIWLTNARPLTVAYDFWKMEVGSDVSLYSPISKFQHPSLPSLMVVGLHLSYFMGADRQAQL